MGFTSDVKNLIADFGTFGPTFILSVPRVFEKIDNSAEQDALSQGRGRIFAASAATAIAWSQAVERDKVGVLLRAKHRFFDRVVYGKLRASMGGRVEYAVCGGAPLAPGWGISSAASGSRCLRATDCPRPRRRQP